MSKFNTNRGFAHNVTSSAVPTGRTYEGAPGYSRDTKSELYLLAVSNMVGEDTFYEGKSDRDQRYVDLVHAATIADPIWTAQFLKWLRSEANMRTASIVGAAEFVKAWGSVKCECGRNQHPYWSPTLGQPVICSDGYVRETDSVLIQSRKVVDSVIQRADEPGEMLAYWTSQYGKNFPMPLKRGVADAVIRLGTEFNYVKWDSEGRGFRFADILNLTHPGDRRGSAQHLRGAWQHELFSYVVKSRYEDEVEIPSTLQTLTRRAALLAMPVNERRTVLESPQMLAEAGMTWESLAGWLQGPMDAQAWEAIIPSMGYMALLRNLRNFDQAGISEEVAQTVVAKLADPEQVVKSRQLPMRFLSAYRNSSERWHSALEIALQHSLSNIPQLAGRTLVLVDRSASMGDRMSAKSDLNRADAAAIFGTALAMRCENADLVQFGSNSAPVDYWRAESILKSIALFGDLGGTQTADAVRRWFNNHDRVVIITDEQAWGGWMGEEPTRQVPAEVPVYTWNLAGYKYGHGPSGANTNRHVFGGLSDQAFKMIPLIEAGPEVVLSIEEAV